MRYKDWRLAFGFIEGEEIVGGLEGNNKSVQTL